VTKSVLKKSRILQVSFFTLIFSFAIQLETYAQFGMLPPQPPRTVRLFDKDIQGFSLFAEDSLLFKNPKIKFKRTVTLDSTGQFISVSEYMDESETVLPAVVDLETYIKLRLKFDNKELWKKTFVEIISSQVEQESGAIQLDIPIKIRNETFKRIFGSDRVGLKVTGNISFDLSGRSEERSGTAVSATQNQGSFSPRFSQTQQFTIEGKIGEKVTVSVEQNSEATFDFENTIQIRYDGDDDEIIQSIEAGNIGLSLPSTKYVIFGGSNSGLFGIKTNIQVGDFYFTGIASLEKGEQQKLTISGSAAESKSTIRDYEYIKNRYFFVDQYYVDYSDDGWTNDLSNWQQFPDRFLKFIDVYISTTYTDPDAIQAIAVLDPNDPKWANVTPAQLDTMQSIGGQREKQGFKRLKEGDDYNFNDGRGFIWLNQSARDAEVLAIAFETDQGQTGTLFKDISDSAFTNAPVFKLIKPKSMQPSNVETWPLMLKNVYSLGGTRIEEEGFDVQIKYNVGGQEEKLQQVEPRETFLYLMGLDRRDPNGAEVPSGDTKIDISQYTLNLSEGTLIFPALNPFEPEVGGDFEIDTSYFVDIYNTTNTADLQDAHKFDIEVISKSTKSTFDLGFNILEGSEEVLLNGGPLKRDTDYLIDYFTGSLTLLSPEAKRSSANLEIKYEKATIFQLDKKTIMGGRAEYRFWENSFIGFTGLYLNKSTLDQRVRVGQEPFQNFVWDINTSLKFKPNFLTKAVDALPIVETNEQSTLEIEAEFAQVLPNPNTLDNPETKDYNGVAYVDDFEGSKRTTPLGIRYQTWTPASPPAQFPLVSPQELVEVDDLSAFHAKGNIEWYNPYTQVHINDIWPNRDVNAQTGRTTDVLACKIWRDEDQDPDSAWAGFMRTTYSFADQQKTKFIEFWILPDASFDGMMHIDVGTISEDWWLLGENFSGQSSRRNLNTEDKNANGILDVDEDTGIDGVLFSQHPAGWPDDRWRQPDKNSNDYSGINGTEGNSQARGASYPDTEDLDGDGQVNLINKYFEYSMSLDPKDPQTLKWQSGYTEKGWRQYRIPLNEAQHDIGGADSTFQQVYSFRIWFSGLSTEPATIKFATMDFVGNEWEERGYADTDSLIFTQDDDLFAITVYNTEENADATETGIEPYHSPPGVAGIKDRITEALSKEQSMIYSITELPSLNVAEAKKTLYGNVLSLVNYKKLKMFVHGDQWLPGSPSSESGESTIQVYLKFGADEKNYYEYGQDIYAHWYSGNEFNLVLDDLARTKDEEIFVDEDSTIKRIDLPGNLGKYYQAKGNPSLNTVRYFIIGVRNNDGESLEPWNGEIWFDELRVSDVRQESGTALRLRTALKVADLLTFNGEWESKDADFHDIKTQFGSGNTKESQSYSGKINVDKFLPENWDMSIQVDGSARFNKQIPKYEPRTDILTNYKNDSFNDKIKSLFGLKKLNSEVEEKVTYQKNYGYGATIKRRRKSDIWYLRYTIDQINYDFDYAYSFSRNYETEYNISERYKQSLTYSIPFGKNNYFQPFAFLANKPILNELAEQKFYYSPSSTNFSFSINDNKSTQKRRDDVKITDNKQVNSARNVKIGYRLLPSVDMNFSRQYKSNADYVGLTGTELIESILTKFYFGKDTDINQNFGFNYKPKLINWITTDYSFNSSFRYFYANLDKNQKSSSNNTSKKFTFSFSPSQVANMIYTPDGGSSSKGTTAKRSRGRGRPKKQEPKDDEKEKGEDGEEKPKEEENKESKSIKIPNPLILIHSFFDAWKKIQMSYTWDQNVANSFVTNTPKWDYQFGFSQNTGVNQDSNFTGGALIGPSTTDKRSLRTSLSFDIISNVKTTFKHDWSRAETKSDKSHTGNESTTFLAWGDDPIKDFSGLSSDIRQFIPDWSIKVSGVEKFLFFSSFAKTMSIEHSRNGKYSENKKLVDASLIPTSQSFTHNYQPLIGVNISWLWGISSNIRITESTSYSFTTGGGAQKNETSSFTVSGSYATSGGFSIPIPIWPFKGATFKNEMNITLTYDQSENISYQKKIDQAKFQENQKNSSWKLRPSATYKFNKRVSGSLFYEMGATENKISGKYSYNEFGITVNIAIRD
jgi:motility/secretion related protein SprA